MQKWKKSYDKKRRYQPKWEKDFQWLSQASNGKAFCQKCQCCILPKYSNLTQHESTEKHKLSRKKSQSTVNQTSSKTRKKRNVKMEMEVNEITDLEELKESKEMEDQVDGTADYMKVNDQEEHEEEEEEEAEEEEEEENANKQEENLAKGNEKQAVQFDTTEEFGEVFGSKVEFDSWEEFTKMLEEFQLKTGTCFKPRSACSVDYANERRINGQIPERFVYSNVKMICQYFGIPQKRGAGHRKSYVGRGCGACMNVSYNRGALRITQANLVHNNHAQDFEMVQAPQRHLRAFNFTEELDLIAAREVLKTNPFEFVNGEKQWTQAVAMLRKFDEFADITPRLVKKRIRFLLDKFLAISHGRQPPSEDEMGCILYELNKAKTETLNPPSGRGRKKRGPGRPRIKRSYSDEEEFDEEEIISDSGPKKRKIFQSPPQSESSGSGEITALLSYLKRKDEEDRTLRQKEIDLRRDELSFQKQRFEFEKMERKAHLDLLKAQLQTFEHGMASKQATVVAPKDTNQVTEYTIVVDNNNRVLESLPPLG